MSDERIPLAVERLLELVRRAERQVPSEAPVDDLAWVRSQQVLDGRSKPWLDADVAEAGPGTDVDRGNPSGGPIAPTRMAWLGAAAGLLLVVALGWFLSVRPAGPPEPSGVVRGASLEALAPRGFARPGDLFQWRSSNPLPASYSVEVRRPSSGEVVWRAAAAAGRSSLALPDLDLGSPLQWRVVADLDGQPVPRTEWIDFFVDTERAN